MWKIKKMDCFAKIAWHLFVSGRERKTHFRAHYLFWPKIFFGPKQCKPGKTIKIVVSAESGQNQKWHFFWKRCFFWHGWKVGFNCVFEKLCFAESTIFIVFSAKHSFSKTRTVCWKKQKFYDKSWFVFEHGKMVFFGFVFLSGFNVIVFLCLVKLQKCLKMFVFPSLGGFVGWVILVHLGLEGLGVWCSCVCFFFCLVLFFWFALFLFCFWIVFGVGFCSAFVFYIVSVFFFFF